MIESRYKIEYVLPDEDVKKTSSFRVLWYLLLIPLVLLFVTAITYDFSLKEMSRDSLVLIEKTKVHVFNLGESKNIVKPASAVVKKAITTEPPSVSKNIEKKSTKSVAPEATATTPKAVIDKNKVIISELTTKQELQLKSLKTQIAANKELTQSLNTLSEKLVLEQIKTQQLNSRLTEQEKDRIDLEEQLNKLLTISADKAIELEDVTILEKKESPITIIEPKITKKVETIETKSADIAQEETQIELVQEVETTKEQKKEKSETDKIIEAMASIESEKKEDIKFKVEPEASTKVDLQTKKEEIDIAKSEKENISKEKNTLNEDLTTNRELSVSTESSVVTQESEEIEKDETKEIENTNAKTEITDISSKVKPEEKLDISINNTQAANNNSSVDDIVATMQASSSSKINNLTLDPTQNIDTELEKDIKQQLVEKGELSIDN